MGWVGVSSQFDLKPDKLKKQSQESEIEDPEKKIYGMVELDLDQNFSL